MSIAERAGVVDALGLVRLAAQEHLALVGLLEAADDLHQRRLAGAVVAEQPQHLALAQVQADVAQRDDRPEALGDVLHAEDVVRPQPPRRAPLPDAADVGVGGHRDDDRQAQVEAQVVGVDALDDQAVVEDARAAARRSARRPRCPSRRRAACPRSPRPRCRRRARSWRPTGRAAPRSCERPRARRRGPRSALQRMKLRMMTRRTLMPGLGRAVAVAADGDRVDAPARVAQHELQDDHDRPAPRSAPSRCRRRRRVANVVISPMTVVPGVATGWASEMISVKPLSAAACRAW